MTYQVKDSKTGNVVGTYATRNRADRRADKLDADYGAVRYIVTYENGNKPVNVESDALPKTPITKNATLA